MFYRFNWVKRFVEHWIVATLFYDFNLDLYYGAKSFQKAKSAVSNFCPIHVFVSGLGT